MFTFGTDPEFMLTDPAKNSLSAIDYFPDKDHKISLGKHFVYYDNVMIECEIMPAKSRVEAIGNIRDCMNKLQEKISPNKIICRAADNYPPNLLKHPEARKIACHPEMCAYTLSEVYPPKQEFLKNNLRIAGGHIHLGSDLFKKDIYNYWHVTRLLDLFLSIPLQWISGDSTEATRKKLYGKAGRFRRPTYGIEYRTPSNNWLFMDLTVGLVYDICEFVLNLVESGRHLEIWQIDKEKIEDPKNWSNPMVYHKCLLYDYKEVIKTINSCVSPKEASYYSVIETYLPKEIREQINDALAFK